MHTITLTLTDEELEDAQKLFAGVRSNGQLRRPLGSPSGSHVYRPAVAALAEQVPKPVVETRKTVAQLEQGDKVKEYGFAQVARTSTYCGPDGQLDYIIFKADGSSWQWTSLRDLMGPAPVYLPAGTEVTVVS
jgi:hypothetical protein